MQIVANNLKTNGSLWKMFASKLQVVQSRFGVMVESHIVEGRQDLVDG